MKGIGSLGLIIVGGDAAEFLAEVIRKKEGDVRELRAVEPGHAYRRQSCGNFGHIREGDSVVAKTSFVHQGRRDGVRPGNRRLAVVERVGLSAAESTCILTAQWIVQGGVIPEEAFRNLVLCSNDAVHVDIELVFVERQWLRNGEQSESAGRSDATWGRLCRRHEKPTERPGSIEKRQCCRVDTGDPEFLFDIRCRALRGINGYVRRDRAGDAVDLPRTLIGAKEKGVFEFWHGPAKVSAKLVLF